MRDFIDIGCSWKEDGPGKYRVTIHCKPGTREWLVFVFAKDEADARGRALDKLRNADASGRPLPGLVIDKVEKVGG